MFPKNLFWWKLISTVLYLPKPHIIPAAELESLYYIIESIAWVKIEYVAEKYEGSTSYHGMIVYEQTPVKKDVELYIALTMMWILFSLAGFWFIHCLFLPIVIRCYSVI